MEPHIVVQGSAEARAMPDRAVIQVTVDADAGTRDDAYAQVVGSARQVDAVLAARDGALDRVTTAALLVQPRTRWRKGESVRSGWRASRTSVVEVADLSALGELTAELAAAGGAVVGPSWHLDPTNAVYAEVRGRAASDARSRAESYAAALGVRIVGVAWIAEPGLRTGGDHPVPMTFASARSLAAPGGAAEDVVDVAVDEVTVEARVDVGFELAPQG